VVSKLPYDSRKDLAPVGAVAQGLHMLLVQHKLAAAALDPSWMNAQELAATVRSDIDKWARVARIAGIKTE